MSEHIMQDGHIVKGGNGTKSDEHGMWPTDQEALSLMTQGLSNREIAKVRGVSPQAIKNSVSRIYEVLGVSGEKRVKAVLWALRNGYPR